MKQTLSALVVAPLLVSALSLRCVTLCSPRVKDFGLLVCCSFTNNRCLQSSGTLSVYIPPLISANCVSVCLRAFFKKKIIAICTNQVVITLKAVSFWNPFASLFFCLYLWNDKNKNKMVQNTLYLNIIRSIVRSIIQSCSLQGSSQGSSQDSQLLAHEPKQNGHSCPNREATLLPLTFALPSASLPPKQRPRQALEPRPMQLTQLSDKS